MGDSLRVPVSPGSRIRVFGSSLELLRWSHFVPSRTAGLEGLGAGRFRIEIVVVVDASISEVESHCPRSAGCGGPLAIDVSLLSV